MIDGESKDCQCGCSHGLELIGQFFLRGEALVVFDEIRKLLEIFDSASQLIATEFFVRQIGESSRMG